MGHPGVISVVVKEIGRMENFKAKWEQRRLHIQSWWSVDEEEKRTLKEFQKLTKAEAKLVVMTAKTAA